MLRIKFFGEGKADVGDPEQKKEFEYYCSILQLFVKNILKKYKGRGVNFDCEVARIPRLHELGRAAKAKPKGFERKVYVAMSDARYDGFNGGVFVVDYTGHGGKDRLNKMNEGRRKALKDFYHFPMALGVAIMELETWLLADGQTRSKHLTKGAGRGLGNVESIKDPKSLLNQLYGEYAKDKSEDECEPRSSIMLDLAENSDMDVIARECPKGFKPFMEEVRTELLPLFKRQK